MPTTTITSTVMASSANTSRIPKIDNTTIATTMITIKAITEVAKNNSKLEMTNIRTISFKIISMIFKDLLRRHDPGFLGSCLNN